MTRSVGGSSSARRALSAVAIGALAVAAVAAALVWNFAYDEALKDRVAEARAKLAFTTDTLERSFVRYKLLAKAMSQTGAVRRRATLDYDGGVDEAAALLDRMAAISGAAEIRFATRTTSPGGAFAEAVRSAYQGVMGLAFDRADGGSFLVAAPVWNDRSEVVGAVVARQTSAELEFAWRALPETVFFGGLGGEIRLSSAPSLRLKTLYSADAPLPSPAARKWGEWAIWRFDDEGWRSLAIDYEEAVLITRPAPAVDMTAYMLIDTAPSRRSAAFAAAAAAVFVIALALALGIILQRRSALRARLAIEERANAELELKVADRTVELTAEIEERRAVTRRLRDAQEDLVQAGKLAALGRMAAGIAHEINQPLAAIRNFAENAVTFLERGREEEARGNLRQIADLTDRAARIIRNLRAFARNEAETIGPVPVADAVEGALTILSPRIREAGAEIGWAAPPGEVYVDAGLVRLQQVIINLVSNGLDAQAGAPDPRVDISIQAEGATVSMAIRDYGPGLSEEARAKLFEPFYSTKANQGEGGLGLGLAISYGIARGFGGELSARNDPAGGAVFALKLRRAEAPRAAA